MNKEKMIGTIKYWSQAFLIPIYGLSFFVPRTKRIWLFGSSFGNLFIGNPKYFYLYVNQFKKDEVRPIWITHDKKIVKLLRKNHLECYYYRSIPGIYYCLRSKVYIFDNYSKDISFWLSGGAVKFNLWHGSGNKKTNYDNKFDRIRHPANRLEQFKNIFYTMSNEKPDHYTLATSEMMAKIFMSAMQTDREHIIIEGYPRNDSLFPTKLKNIYGAERFLLREMCTYKKEGKRILVYMPTFRASEGMFFQTMNLEVFNKYLKERNYIFYTKLHPKSKLKEEFSKVNYSNIKNISADVDPYTFLRRVDMLVTDYSSIYSDYLMLNRPSVLFPYDFEEYTKDTRECYFTYEEYMPEIRAYTMQELMNAIDRTMQEDEYEAGRLKLRQRIFKTADGNASKRLYKKIQRILKKK